MSDVRSQLALCTTPLERTHLLLLVSERQRRDLSKPLRHVDEVERARFVNVDLFEDGVDLRVGRGEPIVSADHGTELLLGDHTVVVRVCARDDTTR